MDEKIRFTTDVIAEMKAVRMPKMTLPSPPPGGTETREESKARYRREGRKWIEPPPGGTEHGK